MPTRYTGLPPEIGGAPLRTIRARAVTVYAQPHKELARLQARGLLHRLASGFYAVVPQDRLGRDWRPTLEGAAAGIGAAEFGMGRYALMGLTAARLHRAIPRAIAVAVIAAPRRRETIRLTDRLASIRFLVRDIDTLQVEMMQTDLGSCLATSPEQTVLDLAHLPNIGELEAEATEAIDALLSRCDLELMAQIAATQRLGRAFNRVRRMTA
ncbi:MAG: type IV toxin-antitoxin system AbiEi family antitoxin [Mycobacteriaceae bacterium]|nr:type IV toxin-antitoxin system AbiEi family antitoxin [Mycobacteriaceae bacterium]